MGLGEYLTALAKGNRMPDGERKAVAQKLSRLTGLSQDYVERANLRIDPGRFRKELLRDKRLTVGRLDSRFTAVESDAARLWTTEEPGSDGLAILSLKSKAGTLGPHVVDAIVDAVGRAEAGYRGLVIWQRKPPFSAGADLNAFIMLADRLSFRAAAAQTGEALPP